MSMIIGISGKAGAGKDTVAKLFMLCEYLKTKKLTTMNSPQSDEYMYVLMDWTSSSIMHNIELIRFADKVKDIVAHIIGCTKSQLEDRQFKETPLGEEWWYYKSNTTLVPYDAKHPEGLLIKPTPRMLLQQIGTESGRKIIHPNIWVNATANTIKQYKCKKCIFVIPDLRFPNEKRWIESQKGLTIKVIKDNLPQMNHESETALDDETFDFVIHNNGSLYELYQKIKPIYDSIEMYK